MSERDWAQESVTVYEEGKTRSPDDILAEPVRSDHPLDALPVGDRALYRVVYGLDPTWEDVNHIAEETGRSPSEVLKQIQEVYQRNAHRQVDFARLMEKVVSAYSRLTELAREERSLEEEENRLSHQRPVDGKQIGKVAKRLQQIRGRMIRLRALQGEWREESLKVLRIPSKDVAKIFNISPDAVDKRVERVGRRVRELLMGGEKGDEPHGDRQRAL
jgi:DNA-binding Lrp family transcriptional regulator